MGTCQPIACTEEVHACVRMPTCAPYEKKVLTLRCAKNTLKFWDVNKHVKYVNIC